MSLEASRSALLLEAVVSADRVNNTLSDTTINANWESHRSCVLEPSESQHLLAFQELLKVHNAKYVDQKAFRDRVSHRGLPACVAGSEAETPGLKIAIN